MSPPFEPSSPNLPYSPEIHTITYHRRDSQTFREIPHLMFHPFSNYRQSPSHQPAITLQHTQRIPHHRERCPSASPPHAFASANLEMPRGLPSLHFEPNGTPSSAYGYARPPVTYNPFPSPTFETNQFPPSLSETYSFDHGCDEDGSVLGTDYYSTTSTSPTLPSPPSTSIVSSERSELDEPMGDEPYAQLIYKALLQAPHHRMVLQDIYEWFKRYTTKPQESGSNGWQNSIRHNLSMNHAFENDKTGISHGSSHAKKSNSVWILTQSAVQHGVQSTTRYRKNGNSKKHSPPRAPALQRQKSGAKGGRAARRIAKMKAREGPTRSKHQLLTPSSALHEFKSGYYCKENTDCATEYDPQTPPDDQLFVTSTGLEELSGTPFPADYNAWDEQQTRIDGLHMHDLGYLSSPDVDLDEVDGIKIPRLP